MTLIKIIIRFVIVKFWNWSEAKLCKYCLKPVTGFISTYSTELDGRTALIFKNLICPLCKETHEKKMVRSVEIYNQDDRLRRKEN